MNIMNYHKLSKEELIDLLQNNQNCNEKLERIQFELGERIKELTCHNQLTNLLTDSELNYNEIIYGIVDIIPPAFQFPEKTKVAVTIYDKVYSTPGFSVTNYCLSADIVLENSKIGKIEVCYDDNITSDSQPLFLHEEEVLLFTIASRIAGLTDQKIKSGLRKDAEIERDRSEKLYQSILLASPDNITLTDLQGNIILVSPSAYNMFNLKSEDDYLNKNLTEFIIPEDVERALSNIALMFEGIFTSAIEYTVLTLAGKTFPIEVSGEIIKNEHDVPVNLIFIIRDVSERKLAENELKKSEQKFRNIFETIQDANYEASPEGILIEISPAIHKLSKGQYTREELIGKSFVQFYADADARNKLLEELLKSGYVNDYELNFYNKDGTVIPVSISSNVVKDENGILVKVTGSLRTIEERKQIENSLKESEEKYRLLFENNPQPMWIYDLETLRILEVNQSSIEQYGYSHEEFMQMTIKDISPPEDIPDLMLDIDEVKKKHNNTKSIWRHIWKNGELRYVEINAQSLDYKGRKARHVLINDVTERIRTENEIRNKTNILSNLIINLKEGILLENSERKIILTNQLFCQMFNIGAPAQALIGADCSGSAEESKDLFKHPDKFIADIDRILNDKSPVFNDELELVDGRVFERDYIPTYVDGVYNGHLWKYRDVTERKQAILKLALSEERFSQVVEQSQEVVWEVDANGLYTFVSSMAKTIYGYSPEEMINKMYFYDLCPEAEREQLKTDAFEVFKRKETFTNFVNYAEKKGHERIVLLTNGIPMLDDKGNLIGYRGLDANITETKLAEEKLLKANRLISVISSINQTIVKEKDKDSLFAKVCEIAINSGKFQMAWIGMVDEETKKVIPAFKAGHEDGYLSVIKRISVDENTPEGRGPTGTALREGRFFVTNDIATDPLMAVWKDEALKRNYHSAIAIPIKLFGKTIGAISLYSNQPNFFNEEELELLNDVIDNVSFALETFEIEKVRRKTENELRKLSLAVEQSPVSIVISNLDGNIEYANPMACYTTGYSHEELIGKNPRVLQSGETDKYEYLELWNTITSGASWHGVFHNKKKNGELYWESSTITPITDENGVITNYVAIKEDITERKKSDEDLRKFRTIADKANYGSAITTLQGEILYINQAFANMHDYDAADLTGKNFAIFHNSEQINQVRNLLDNLLKNGEFSSEEVWHTRKDGSVFPTLMNATLIFNDRNEPLFFSATAIDISERIEAERKIQKLSLAVTQSPDLIVITDKNGIIEFVNPAFEVVTGFTFDMVKGKNTRILKSGKNDKQIYVDLWNTINSGKIWTNEWINIKRNGEYYWEHISISPIHDNFGNIINFLAIKQDISDRKRNEQEIKDLNANLERKIEERTAELAATNQNLLDEIAERKRVEESLSISEYKYRYVVENIHEIIFQTDVEGKWTFLNKSWETITGFTIDESLGQLFLNYVYPDDRERNIELFEPLIKREKEYCSHEIRYLTKSGRFRWIEVYAKLNINENNEVTGTYGSLQDITERKRASEFENEMLQLSPQLTGITLTEISSALNLSLSRIGKFLNADRAYIFEFNASKTEMSNTYEWCNDDINPEIENLQNIPTEVFPKWMETILNHENIIIPSVADLPESWQVEREILEPQGIQSLVVIPMISENQVIGFVGLDDVNHKRNYTESEINSLKIWSSILVSLINNYHTEQLIEESRQNFEIFFNTIDDFLWVLDENGNIIHINSTVTNRLGYSTEELEKESVIKVHPEARREEAARIVAEMLEDKAEFCPVPIVTKDGKAIPVETRVKHGYWNSKPAIFGVSKDISKIQLSEQKFATAFQSNSALLAISDYYSGEYVDVNITFVKIIGYSKEELLGNTNSNLHLFEDESLRDEILRKLDSGVSVRELEARIHSKGDKIIYVLLSADIIYVGERKCLLTVSLDISDRKLAEEEMYLARIEAEKANIAKSEFLSRMSHELRTPMNSILGFAQILEMGELNTGQKKSVNHILKSGKHLLGLINEVLDISRIEAGRLSISIEPIKVKTILDEITDIIHPLANERDIKIYSALNADDQLFVSSDRQSLKQVLLNLMNNAVKYNKSGGNIHVEAHHIPGDNAQKDTIRISITDSGIGILEEDIPKLFTPFERIGAHKTDIEGTGLGLAVVKKLIDTMGGTLGVESKLGEGSTFWIQLPATESQLRILANSEFESSENKLQKSKAGTLLYIEDNSSNIELVEQILNFQRPQVQLISNMNGRQAVVLAIEYKPDLILLDLNLPDIHGSEVLKLLKSNPITKEIPVVVLSADAMQKQIENMITSGASSYLTKPLGLTDFLQVIDEFI